MNQESAGLRRARFDRMREKSCSKYGGSEDLKMKIGKMAYLGALILGTLVAAGCGGSMPDDLGARNARLIECPESPNCVSSFAEDEGHAIAALAIEGDAAAAWTALAEVVAATPGVEVVSQSDGYLHAVYTSDIMRYRDDVEFLADVASNEIEVRSASRVGYGDMDANRNRIEALRTALAERGVVASASAE